MVCGVGVGTYPFAAHSGVSIQVTTPGTLACLYVDEMKVNHAQASGTPGYGTMTGRYWLIRGLQSDKTSAAAGFVANLTPPHNVVDDTKALVCRYTGTTTTWNCDRSSSTDTTVTRNGITAFSDWTYLYNMPTAVTLAAFSAAAAGCDPCHLGNSFRIGYPGLQPLPRPQRHRAVDAAQYNAHSITISGAGHRRHLRVAQPNRSAWEHLLLPARSARYP